VAEPIRAGDLTCSRDPRNFDDLRIYSCATVSELHRLRRWLIVLFDYLYFMPHLR